MASQYFDMKNIQSKKEEMAMKFFIREWSKNTVVLMTEGGHVLSYFSSVVEALDACSEWYDINQSEEKYEVMVQYRHTHNTYASVPAMATA